MSSIQRACQQADTFLRCLGQVRAGPDSLSDKEGLPLAPPKRLFDLLANEEEAIKKLEAWNTQHSSIFRMKRQDKYKKRADFRMKLGPKGTQEKRDMQTEYLEGVRKQWPAKEEHDETFRHLDGVSKASRSQRGF